LSYPSNTFSSEVAFHSVLMSKRFAKKSLVSVPGRFVRPPGCDLPWFAPVTIREDPVLGLAWFRPKDAQATDEDRHLRRGQRQELCLVDQQLVRRYAELGLEVVAESVRHRFEIAKGLHVGLLLGSVRAAGREGNGHVVPGLLRGLFDRGRAPKDAPGGKRPPLAATGCAVEGRLDARKGFEHLCQLGRLVDLPTLLRRETD